MELTLKDRLRKAARTVEVRQPTVVGALAAPLRRWTERISSDHLMIVPTDLRTADPSLWDELAHGQFGLAGHMANLRGESPFVVAPPSPAWERELHGFSWLRHLAAAGQPEAGLAARQLALEWIVRFSEAKGIAAEPAVAARRLIAWLSHVDTLLEEADKRAYGTITGSLGRQLTRLKASWREAPLGYPRLLALTGLAFGALSLAGHDRHLKDIETGLAAELAWQILPDGGHVSRNPAVLVELLLDLLPLSQCFTARGRRLPPALGEALERMLPMLRHLRLGDGMLARFNGVGAAPAAGLATVLAYDDGSLSDVGEARASGYARLQRGDTVVLADVGRPPPLALSGSAQAGCLSFEMSAGRQLLFVNGGVPDPSAADWLHVARGTASHNTLTLGEKSSSRLIAHRKLEALVGAAPLRYPDRVVWDMAVDDGAQVLEASHDGYHRRTELMHYRRLRLSADGLRLDGDDRLDGLNGKLRLRADLPFSIHFHLAPGVRADCGDGTREVLIRLADGQLWRFRAEGAGLSVEESAHFAGSIGPRPALQIVLRGATCGGVHVVWSLERQQGAAQ